MLRQILPALFCNWLMKSAIRMKVVVAFMSCVLNMGFPGGSVGKNPPAVKEMQETWVQSLGLEDPLEEDPKGRKQSDMAEVTEHIRILNMSVKVKVTQLCPTLCDPMDYTVHEILQARILEWVAFPFSRGSSQPRDWAQVSHIAGGFFTIWATKEAQKYLSGFPIPSPADLPGPEIQPGSPALQADSLPTDISGNPKYVCTSLKQSLYFFS